MNQVLESREDILTALEETLQTVTGMGGKGFDRAAAQQEVQHLESLAANILELSKGNAAAGDFFENQLAELFDKRAMLLQEIEKAEQNEAESGARTARLQSLMASLQSAPLQLDAYSDSTVREIVEGVKVIDADRLLVVFKGGIEVEAGMGG